MRSLVLLIMFIFNSTAFSQSSLTAGLGLLDEGDDRHRFGLVAHSEFKNYGARIGYFNRSFGPVFEDLFLLSLFKSFDIYKDYNLIGRLGLATQFKVLKLRYKTEADKSFDDKEERFNAGAMFGASWQIINKKYLYCELSWDSLLYPAGVVGGILFSTGVHNIIGLSLGVKL